MLGDADLTTSRPDDDDGVADLTALAIVDRLIRAEEIALPVGADQVLPPLRETLRRVRGPDCAALRQVVEALAWALRAHAAAAGEASQLREALTSRSTIDQAKGVLMAQHQIDPEAAFRMLVRLSNNTNVRLADVARAIVYQAQNGSGSDGAASAAD